MILESVSGKPLDSCKKSSTEMVRVQCDECGDVSTTSYLNYQTAQARFPERQGKTYCRKCSSKRTAHARIGTKPWNYGKSLPHKRGQGSATWKGGRYVNSMGYICVALDGEEHFYMQRSGKRRRRYILEHVLVMETHLGRKLTEHECVHHINGDKQDNRLENLYLCESNSAHALVHANLERAVFDLLKVGLLHFEHDSGKYVANSKLRELLEQPGEANQQPSVLGTA